MSQSLAQKARIALTRNPEQGEGNGSSHKKIKAMSIWMHATSAERLGALGDIARRLKTTRPDLRVLVTTESALASLALPEGCDERGGLPTSDTASGARQFLDRHQPGLCLWTGGGLRPTLIRTAQDRGTCMLLADIQADEVPTRRRRWLTDVTQRMMECFSFVYTPSKDAQERLVRVGYSTDLIKRTTSMRSSVTPPYYHPDDLSELTDSLGGRPVWLAAYAEPEEFETILTAHRDALRRLHRLLLVIVVDCDRNRDALFDAVEHSGLRCTDWDRGEMPSDNTQVLLACTQDGLGLWYRVAPVSLIAGSLEPAWQGHCPMEALALGSAVLFGPGVRRNRALYNRLATDKAAIQINNSQDLATKITHLSAPDKAASMAVAGWEVVTEGAQLADLLVDDIQTFLDQQETQYAGS
ncbi:glycosyltransferase N-terminal domain-containing protein [Aliisedimentitalea scapharcae]|uniref:3-deoxy-D-manno-octulosonic acid transferase n=1 Tax=Aliisedimentitalea scapharcae TaxID=1524259 RepID=A0ABZ2XRY2_9RHOB